MIYKIKSTVTAHPTPHTPFKNFNIQFFMHSSLRFLPPDALGDVRNEGTKSAIAYPPLKIEQDSSCHFSCRVGLTPAEDENYPSLRQP